MEDLINKNLDFTKDNLGVDNSNSFTYSDQAYDTFNKSGYSNIFQRSIDSVILNKYGKLEEKEYINAMKTEQKRMSILSLLNKDNALWSKIFDSAYNTQLNFSEIELLVPYLRQYTNGLVDTKRFGDIKTPVFIVEHMLDKLPKEVWSDPHLKWLDPVVGMGIFPIYVIDRLMKGLRYYNDGKLDLSDSKMRYKHIVENMIYTADIQAIKLFEYNTLVDPKNLYNMNQYWGSFTASDFDNYMERVWCVDSFDIILGNPPYQEENPINKRSKTIYNDFFTKAMSISDKTIFLTPSRWMTGGFKLDTFRETMIKSNIREIIHYEDARDIFGYNVKIRGGVSFTYVDKDYNDLPKFNGMEIDLDQFDIIVDPRYTDLLNKVIEITDSSLSSRVKSQNYFGFPANESLFKEEESEDSVKVYVSKKKGETMWVNKNHIRDSYKLEGYKVFTPAASGSTKELGAFGNKIIGYPSEVASKSYVVIPVDSEQEAQSLVSYMNTKFCNFFLSLRKKTQNIKPDTCKWIPNIPLDRIWNDEELYNCFELTKEEIGLIENGIIL